MTRAYFRPTKPDMTLTPAQLCGPFDEKAAVAPDGTGSAESRIVQPDGRRGPAEDLTGRRFGPWKVKRYAGPGGATPKWFCFCVHCSRTRLVNGAQLRNQPPACGHCGAA